MPPFPTPTSTPEDRWREIARISHSSSLDAQKASIQDAIQTSSITANTISARSMYGEPLSAAARRALNAMQTKPNIMALTVRNIENGLIVSIYAETGAEPREFFVKDLDALPEVLISDQAARKILEGQ